MGNRNRTSLAAAAPASLLMTALILASLPQDVVPFVSVSRWGTSLAYGGAIDGIRMLISGVNYYGDYKHVTEIGQADTDCYVSLGTSNAGFVRTTFDSPQMCLDMEVLNIPNQPDAVVLAMAGQQPMLLSMSYSGGTASKVSLADPVKLPYGYFPAVMAADRTKGGVYVGLHPTNGFEMSAASDSDSVDELKNTWDYLRHLTNPAVGYFDKPSTPSSSSPLIFKYDIVKEKPEWQTTLETDEGITLIGGMGVVPEREALVVGGSTTGYGPSIGAGARSLGNWDGFLTIVNMGNGVIDTKNTTTEINAPHSVRIFSQNGQDDMVLNLCVDDDKVYLVGSTSGKIEGDELGGGFVMKFDIDTLNVIWKKQFVGVGIEATHCAIRNNFAYIGGTVPAGMQLEKPNGNEKGKKTVDIFVALFNAATGEMTFIRQIDSRRDDHIAIMDVNAITNDLVVMANAKDFGEGTNDIYVMQIDKEGHHDWADLPYDIDPIDGRVPSPPLMGIDPPTKKDDEDDWITTVAILVPLSIFFFLAMYYVCTNHWSSKVPMAPTVDGAPPPEDNEEVVTSPAGDNLKLV
eukprot:scaffold2557_cov121-Cylindrotheca_fusiformis.AAC.34